MKSFLVKLYLPLIIMFTLIVPMAINVNTASAETTNVTLKDADKRISLKYDDRYTFKKNIVSITTICVTSKSVKTGEKDTEVLKVTTGNQKKVIAVGCGKALVELKNGTKVGVTVTKAKISLLLLIGQSNMEGSQSTDKSLSDYQSEYIVNEPGQVYSTYGPSTKNHSLWNGCFSTASEGLKVSNASSFVPDTLTDNSSNNEWERTNNLTSASGATGKTGVDGALANEWVKKTGEKVWVVNAAHSGSSITSWQPDKNQYNNFWQAVALYKECEKVLNKEIKAGHYKLSHKGYFWLQGESDHKMAASKYLKYYMKMHRRLKKELYGKNTTAFKYVRKKVEFAGILMVRSHGKPTTTADLKMTGPRQAQYYMCNSNKNAYSDIYLASELSETWSTNAGVKNYFTQKYGTNAKYLAKNTMKKSSVTMPSSIDDVHSTIHYSQLAYNELGRDAVDNVCYAIGYAKAPKTKITIKLVGADGHTAVSSVEQKTAKDASLTVKVFPAWKSKKLLVKKNSSYITYNKWKVNFKSNKVYSSKLQFSVGSTKKKYTAVSTKSTVAINGLSITSEGIQVSWTAASNVSYYKIYRRTAGSKKWKCIEISPKSDGTTYLDSNVFVGVNYVYGVKAYDKYGNSGKMAALSIIA